ncbi:uncharacterized protein LOC127862475 [Dreissena polymorpha]|uniref:uncharacterized protein LOC127862475 n=1 Tax=Dreissena polymorpha TaxID=45954 RepID=UPI002263F7BF|nr:uncharacterized protein LOC127862475 [Dreissena polymorpha]
MHLFIYLFIILTHIRCWCVHNVYAPVAGRYCTDSCGNPKIVCGQQQSNFFSVFNRKLNEIPIFGDSLQHDDKCLVFKPPQTYSWKECTDFHRLLCSDVIDGRRTAIVQPQYSHHWYQANIDCFDQDLFPATLESIRNANVSDVDTTYHWTSYIRTSLVIKANIEGLKLEANNVQYAYMSPDGKVNFTESGQRRALCEDAKETSTQPTDSSTVDHIVSSQTNFRTRSTDISSTQLPAHSTETNKREFLGIGLGIGVPVGIALSIGGLAIIALLRKRRFVSCVKTESSSDNNEPTCKRAEPYNDDLADRNEKDTNYCSVDRYRNVDSDESSVRYANTEQ